MARERGYSDVESGRTDRRVRTGNKGVEMDNIIKMRLAMKDSPEGDWIQEAWVPKMGDRTKEGLILKVYPGHLYIVSLHRRYNVSKEHVLWLPSIEDCLGMVDWDNEERYATLFRLDGKFAINLGRSRVFYGLSWAECWLQVVQHIVKSLSWDREGWR